MKDIIVKILIGLLGFGSLLLFTAIAIGVGINPAHADTKIKFGKFESHIDWGDWSMSTEEKIWQAGHLIDILQTETYHREDCIEEDQYYFNNNNNTNVVVVVEFCHK